MPLPTMIEEGMLNPSGSIESGVPWSRQRDTKTPSGIVNPSGSSLSAVLPKSPFQFPQDSGIWKVP